MQILIGNTVKTEFADYPCATREEAEALYMTLRARAEREQGKSSAKSGRDPAETPAARLGNA